MTFRPFGMQVFCSAKCSALTVMGVLLPAVYSVVDFDFAEQPMACCCFVCYLLNSPEKKTCFQSKHSRMTAAPSGMSAGLQGLQVCSCCRAIPR